MPFQRLLATDRKIFDLHVYEAATRLGELNNFNFSSKVYERGRLASNRSIPLRHLGDRCSSPI